MRAIRLHPATLAATCLLVLAGCGGVEFEHPLSDEKTSEVDARLIGFWEPVPASLMREEPATGELWQHLAVGRDAAQPAFMEAVSLEMDDEVVKVERTQIRATVLGAHRYLSVRMQDDEKEGSPQYYVVRYALVSENLLRLWLLEEEVLARAVEAGELSGTVHRPEEADDFDGIEVKVDSDAAAVRSWLAAHEACVKEDPIYMRRLVEKGPEDEPVATPSEGPDEEDDAEDDE